MATDPSDRERRKSDERWYPSRSGIWPVSDDAGQPVRKLRPAAKVGLILANVLVLGLIALVIWSAVTR